MGMSEGMKDRTAEDIKIPMMQRTRRPIWSPCSSFTSSLMSLRVSSDNNPRVSP